MKKELFRAAVVVVPAAVLLAALLVAGCSNPLTGAPAGSEEAGFVLLRFSDVQARSIVPAISLDTAYYDVTFTRTGFQDVELTGKGSDQLSVTARETVTVPVSIQSLSKDGMIGLSAELSELRLLDPSISGTLTPGRRAALRWC